MIPRLLINGELFGVLEVAENDEKEGIFRRSSPASSSRDIGVDGVLAVFKKSEALTWIPIRAGVDGADPASLPLD